MENWLPRLCACSARASEAREARGALATRTERTETRTIAIRLCAAVSVNCPLQPRTSESSLLRASRSMLRQVFSIVFVGKLCKNRSTGASQEEPEKLKVTIFVERNGLFVKRFFRESVKSIGEMCFLGTMFFNVFC